MTWQVNISVGPVKIGIESFYCIAVPNTLYQDS